MFDLFPCTCWVLAANFNVNSLLRNTNSKQKCMKILYVVIAASFFSYFKCLNLIGSVSFWLLMVENELLILSSVYNLYLFIEFIIFQRWNYITSRCKNNFRSTCCIWCICKLHFSLFCPCIKYRFYIRYHWLQSCLIKRSFQYVPLNNNKLV